MKPCLLVLLLLTLIVVTPAVAQFTSVTLQVADTPDGQTWNNGTWQAKLITKPGQTPTGPPFNFTAAFGGGTVPNQFQTGSLSGSGGASSSMADNLTIAPTGSIWSFTVCPQATASCFSTLVTITGASQTVTITPPAVRVNTSLAPPLAYADAELLNPALGSFYFNLSTLTQRFWNGSVWAAGSGGGGGGSGTVNPNNGSASTFTYYPTAGGSTVVSPNPRLTEITSSTVLNYSGTGGITGQFSLNTPQINGIGTGGYNLTSVQATLPSPPAAGNNGLFSGPSGWAGSHGGDAFAVYLRTGHVAASDITSGLLTNAQMDTTTGANGLGSILIPWSSVPNCTIYLGFSNAASPGQFNCNGLAQNLVTGATYTVLSSDLLDVDKYTGATASAWTLAAPSGSFTPPFAFTIQNASTGGGQITLTPQGGSTIDGVATLIIPSGNNAFIYTCSSNWCATMPPNNGGVVTVQ